VFPLDNRSLPRFLEPKPTAAGDRSIFTYTSELANTPSGGAPSFLDRSYKITAEVEIPSGGAEGMLVTDGGRFGGIGFYLLGGRPQFVYNFNNLERFRWQGKDALAPGKHTLVFDFKYEGVGFGHGGTGTLIVDGKTIEQKRIPKTMKFVFPEDETFDVGIDTRTPIAEDYQVPFRFTGKLVKLTVEIPPIQATIAEILAFKWATRD
jgi:arylsulfatase